jgi:hypothetical protein
MYVSAGGWDKSFVFYDDGVMNSQNNTTTKKALTPFFTTRARPVPQTKQRSARVCCPSFSFVFPPFFEQRNDYTRSKTHHNNTSIKYLI